MSTAHPYLLLILLGVTLAAFRPLPSVDDGKGVGPVKTVALTFPPDAAMVARGKALYGAKCAVCHKLTDERTHGPGWAGVTTRRKPEWIMNMIVNPSGMLVQDPAAMQLATQFLIKMPDQKITVEQARDLLEFMRSNDGEK